MVLVNKLPPESRNKLGIAVSRQAYKAYRDLLDTDRWQRLENLGARPQRLLFASTSTKDKALSTKVGDVAGTKPVTIYLTIQKLTGIETVHTTTLKEATSDMRKVVSEMLLAAITDTSLLAQTN